MAGMPIFLFVGREFHQLFYNSFNVAENFRSFQTAWGMVKPDSISESAVLEIKYVQSIESLPPQLQAELALVGGRPVHLVVAPHTEVAEEVLSAIAKSGGRTVVFNPETGALLEYGTAGAELTAEAAWAIIGSFSSRLVSFFTMPFDYHITFGITCSTGGAMCPPRYNPRL
jgi:hypothetical protein